MKTRVTHCSECEKERLKKQCKLCEECQFDIFSKIADDVGKSVIAAALFSQVQKKRTKKYIQQMYNAIIFVLEYPEIYGKSITSTQVMQLLETEYNIDFNRLHIRTETKEDFTRRSK